MKKIWHIFFIVITILCCVLYAVALCSPLISPTISYIPAIITLGFPFLTIAVLLLTVLWLKYNWYYALTPLLLLLISLPAIDRTFQFSVDKRNQQANSIKIATYNMHGMQNYTALSELQQKQQRDQWHKMERQCDGIDILCVQEYNSAVRAFLLEEYDHQYGASCSGAGSTRILSRYPIIDKGCLTFSDYRIYKGIWADIKYLEDTIRVYSIHLESNKISDYEKELTDQWPKESDFVYDRIYKMLATYKDNAKTRIEQVAEVLESVRQSPYPVILTGDFNEIPQSYLYRQITDRFQDVFLSKGSGFDPTYAGKIPLLRIDYIFTDTEFEHIDFHVGSKVKISDHYPVVASVRLGK